MCSVEQLTPSPRLRSFWQFQLGGWFLYALTVAASLFPMRNMRDDVAYHAMFLVSGFAFSFLMYGVCHALWQARVPLIRALFTCTVVAYGLGFLVSAISVWTELRFGEGTSHFHWSNIFVYATGSC